MIKDIIEMRVREDPYGDRLACALFIRRDGQRVMVADNVSFVELPENQPVDHPTFTLERNEASLLMDELWRAGIRPKEVGSIGELSAVKYHLEDMRKLLFSVGALREGTRPRPRI